MNLKNMVSRIPKWRIVLYLFLSCGLGVIALIPGGTANFRSFVVKLLPVPQPHQLRLSADPYERGKEHGQKFHWEILFLDKLYIRYFASKNKFPFYLERAEKVFAGIDPRWTREISGVAAASGTRPSTLMLGNSFLDMGLNASGCRQIHVSTPGGLLHSHNLDWDNLGGIGNYLVTFFRSEASKGRFRTVHLGFPGMIGALDIINEHGVALSFNQVGISNGETTFPVFIAMRDIAETCDTFEKAEQRILSLAPGMPFCIGLSDAKNGKMAVYERELNHDPVSKRMGVGGILTADNSVWGPENRRSHTVDEIVHAAKPDSPAGVQKLLRHPKIMLACNLYSVIFDYRNN